MKRFLPTVATVMTLTSSVAALAKSGGAHEAPHISNWWGLGAEHSHAPAFGWLTVTFLIFAGIMFKFVWGPLNVYLQNRSDNLKDALQEAERAKAAAEAKAKEAEARLAKLESEMSTLKSEFEAQGKAEAERLEEAGKLTADRLAKDAEDTIAAEMAKATEALKQEAAKMALQLAEERIRAAVNSDDEGRMRKSFLQDLAS